MIVKSHKKGSMKNSSKIIVLSLLLHASYFFAATKSTSAVVQKQSLGEPEITLTPEIQQQLEEIEKELSAKNTHHVSVLLQAIRSKKILLALYLIKNNPELILSNGPTITPLDASINSSLNDVATAIIEKEPRAVNQLSPPYNISPLIYALNIKNIPITELLIARGADVNTESDLDQTPLFLAAVHNLSEIIDLLLAKGANIAHVNKKQQSLLHKLTLRPNGLMLIINKISDQKNGAELLQTLINKEGAISIFGVDPMSFVGTALAKAVSETQPESVDILLSHGADITIPTNQGLTPLDCAIKELLSTNKDPFSQKAFIILQKLLHHRDISKIINRPLPTTRLNPLCTVLLHLDTTNMLGERSNEDVKRKCLSVGAQITRIISLLIQAGAECDMPGFQRILKIYKDQVAHEKRAGSAFAEQYIKTPSGEEFPFALGQEIGEFLGAEKKQAKKTKPNPWATPTGPHTQSTSAVVSPEENWYAE